MRGTSVSIEKLLRAYSEDVACARGTLNLGILAHVDAGKTTLTERLLYCAGDITAGKRRRGTTRSVSLALTPRGITIKSAVVSFTVDGPGVNLIDTPGHPDFIAEVDRALSVLDGVVLVVSAVEGVQPQTRILWRALRRLRVPTLFFVNKIDRLGAGDERLLADIAGRLTPAIIPMGSVTGLGSAGPRSSRAARPTRGLRLAEALAEHDDAVLPPISTTRRRHRPTGSGASWPVRSGDPRCTRCFSGPPSPAQGRRPAARARLPAARGGRDAGGPVSARVFKVERGAAGDKLAYARVFSGTIAIRGRVNFARRRRQGKRRQGHRDQRLRRRHRDPARLGDRRPNRQAVRLADIQVGDVIGTEPGDGGRTTSRRRRLRRRSWPATRATRRGCTPPSPSSPSRPLINVRQDDLRQEIYVSLYGEVQKQVIEATLATD